MKNVTSKKGNEMFIFESVAEAVRFCKDETWEETNKSAMSSEFVFGDEADEREIWKTWGDATASINKPWDNGIKVLEKFVERIKKYPLPDLKSRMRKTSYTDEGDEIDIDRLRAGQAAFRTTKAEHVEGFPEVTIVIDVTTPYYEKSTNILWRGAAGVALAEILEAKGYRCEIWLTCGSRLFRHEYNKVVTSIMLKRTSDPLDRSTLVNAVSGWYYRTLMFCLFEQECKEAGKKVENGYGTVYTPAPSELDELSRDPNRIYCSGMFSFDGSMSLIRHEIDKLAKPQNN